MTSDTRKDLLDELQRLAEELGTTPASTDMNESGAYWASQYIDEFGGWNDALREVGLEPNQPRKIPTDELLNEIRRLARKVNRTPTKKQMDDLGEYYGGTYLNRFGSWNEAIRQAGFNPNRRIPETEFIDRPDVCPLCGESSADGLDFHHWRYGENKTGCYLCRECHDHVHAGGARPDENSRWLMQAVENLIREHSNRRENTTAAAIAERYNIPSEALVEAVISDIEV